MNPLEFLTVADALRGSTDEAERRTSIGRSYYTLYNFLIDRLASHQVQFSQRADDHGRLAYYLTSSSDKNAYKVGATLKSLRIERNTADYEMGAAIPQTKSESVFKQTQAALTIFTNNINAAALATRIKALPPYQPKRP